MRDKYIYVKEHKVLLEYVDNIGYEPISIVRVIEFMERNKIWLNT